MSDAVEEKEPNQEATETNLLGEEKKHPFKPNKNKRTQ